MTPEDRARYKLKQAQVALGYLRQAPKDIALELRKARSGYDPKLMLDTHFFACLGLAKSAYYIIKDTEDGKYRDSIHRWRMTSLSHKARTQFNLMMRLRDIDVHQGESDGEVLRKMIPIEDNGWNHQPAPNYAALGITRPMTTHQNADGLVQSDSGLQQSMAGYIMIDGKKCDTATACQVFITQLRQMIDMVSVDPLPPLSLFWRVTLCVQKRLLRIKV